MNRSGWFRDSYRHSLAARGIKVNLNKYAGTWHQKSVINEPWFQKGCKKVTAKYTLRPDGKIDIINKCDGRSINGVAESVSKDNGKLKVDFGFPFPKGDYNIISVDPEYKHAKVKSGDTVWELERNSFVSKGFKKEWRAKYPHLVKSEFPGENPRLTPTYAKFLIKDPKLFDKFVTKWEDGARIVMGRSKKTSKFEIQSISFPRG